MTDRLCRLEVGEAIVAGDDYLLPGRRSALFVAARRAGVRIRTRAVHNPNGVRVERIA